MGTTSSDRAAAIPAGRKFLLAAQGTDGGWSYQPRGQSSPEPTCYSLMALAFAKGELDGAAAREKAIRWLLSRQNSDGALTLEGDSEPHWTTSLFVLALKTLGAAEDQRAKAANQLMAWETRLVTDRSPVALDGRLRGWPWMNDTFSWVEPTSCALLALKRCGMRSHPRVAEAERMLLDRLCKDGGWNYGNPTVYGASLPAFIPTTALAALALQDVPAAADAVKRSLDFLEREIQTHQSALSLARTILCFATFGRPATALAQALAKRQEADGSWRQQVHLTAQAVLALQTAEGETNLFALPDARTH